MWRHIMDSPDRISRGVITGLDAALLRVRASDSHVVYFVVWGSCASEVHWRVVSFPATTTESAPQQAIASHVDDIYCGDAEGDDLCGCFAPLDDLTQRPPAGTITCLKLFWDTNDTLVCCVAATGCVWAARVTFARVLGSDTHSAAAKCVVGKWACVLHAPGRRLQAITFVRSDSSVSKNKESSESSRLYALSAVNELFCFTLNGEVVVPTTPLPLCVATSLGVAFAQAIVPWAHRSSMTDPHVLCVSGTYEGHVVGWSCVKSRSSASDPRLSVQTLFRAVAHKPGCVILGLSVLVLKGQNSGNTSGDSVSSATMLIATASDDRSTSVFAVTASSVVGDSFADTFSSALLWKATGPSFALSRVRGVYLSRDTSPARALVTCCGEDGAVQVWRVSTSVATNVDELADSGECLFKQKLFSGHGASAASLCTEASVVISGGFDGSLLAHRLTLSDRGSTTCRSNTSERPPPVGTEVILTVPPHTATDAAVPQLRCLCVCRDTDAVVGITDTSCLITTTRYRCTTRAAWEWADVASISLGVQIKACTVLCTATVAVSPSERRHVIQIACCDGRLFSATLTWRLPALDSLGHEPRPSAVLGEMVTLVTFSAKVAHAVPIEYVALNHLRDAATAAGVLASDAASGAVALMLDRQEEVQIPAFLSSVSVHPQSLFTGSWCVKGSDNQSTTASNSSRCGVVALSKGNRLSIVDVLVNFATDGTATRGPNVVETVLWDSAQQRGEDADSVGHINIDAIDAMEVLWAPPVSDDSSSATVLLLLFASAAGVLRCRVTYEDGYPPTLHWVDRVAPQLRFPWDISRVHSVSSACGTVVSQFGGVVSVMQRPSLRDRRGYGSWIVSAQWEGLRAPRLLATHSAGEGAFTRILFAESASGSELTLRSATSGGELLSIAAQLAEARTATAWCLQPPCCESKDVNACCTTSLENGDVFIATGGESTVVRITTEYCKSSRRTEKSLSTDVLCGGHTSNILGMTFVVSSGKQHPLLLATVGSMSTLCVWSHSALGCDDRSMPFVAPNQWYLASRYTPCFNNNNNNNNSKRPRSETHEAHGAGSAVNAAQPRFLCVVPLPCVTNASRLAVGASDGSVLLVALIPPPRITTAGHFYCDVCVQQVLRLNEYPRPVLCLASTCLQTEHDTQIVTIAAGDSHGRVIVAECRVTSSEDCSLFSFLATQLVAAAAVCSVELLVVGQDCKQLLLFCGLDSGVVAAHRVERDELGRLHLSNCSSCAIGFTPVRALLLQSVAANETPTPMSLLAVGDACASRVSVCYSGEISLSVVSSSFLPGVRAVASACLVPPSSALFAAGQGESRWKLRFGFTCTGNS